MGSSWCIASAVYRHRNAMQTNTKISHCESLLDRHAVNRNTHLVVAWCEMSSLGSSLYFRSVSLYIYIYKLDLFSSVDAVQEIFRIYSPI